MRLTKIPLIVLALGLGACNQAPPPVDKAAIEKNIRDYETAWAKEIATSKDVDKWLAHYTPDAIIMGGMPAAKGTDAVRAALTQLVKDPNGRLEFSTSKVEVSDAGDMVATQGTYSMAMTNPATGKPMDDKGSYVTVYHKQADGSWKASLDITGTDGPPPPPAMPAKARMRKKKK